MARGPFIHLRTLTTMGIIEGDFVSGLGKSTHIIPLIIVGWKGEETRDDSMEIPFP